MQKITEEVKEKNFSLFLKKLEKLGIDTKPFVDVLGEQLKNATFALNADSGVAFDGSLIEIILKRFTVNAIKLNEILGEDAKVNADSLVKVCLLHQISKCMMFVKNDNEWEITKRGLLYKYAPSNVALKMGIRSVILCQNLGVTFSEEEIEAMTILDRDDNDEQVKHFASPMAAIVKMASELTYLKNRNGF